MTINVVIERLVLEGVPVPTDAGPAVGAALQTELARLLTDRPISNRLRNGGSLTSARGSLIQVAARMEPAGLGERIATAVYSSLGDGQ